MAQDEDTHILGIVHSTCVGSCIWWFKVHGSWLMNILHVVGCSPEHMVWFNVPSASWVIVHDVYGVICGC